MLYWYKSSNTDALGAEDAASCTTLEYNKLEFEHPGLGTLTIDEYTGLQEKPVFDVARSISSFEHADVCCRTLTYAGAC